MPQPIFLLIKKFGANAEALKRGASLEERLLADGVAGRFPAEVDTQDWRDTPKMPKSPGSSFASASTSARPLRSRGARGAPGGELRDAPREARGPEAAPDSHERHRLAGADRERALVSKKMLSGCRSRVAAKSATLAALERVEKVRKELDELSL